MQILHSPYLIINQNLRVMWIRNRVVHVYDIEIFPNVFHCTCKDTETGQLYKFEISDRKNQLKELFEFFYFNTKEDYFKLFCGYNNHHYDDVIINYIIDYYYKLADLPYWKICQSLFNLSKVIVEDTDGSREKIKRWKYAHYFESMDLLTMQFSQKLRVGLKTMQVTMHYRNVQEYDGDFDQFLPLNRIDEMIAYNINDVESTTELLNRLKEHIELRLFIEQEHGIDCLSMDSVKMAETFLLEKYSQQSGIPKNVIKEWRSPMDYIPLKDVILPFIKFKNPKLQEVLEDMKKQVVYSKERKGYEKKFVLSNVVYSVGVGGIHSIHTPKIFRPNADEYIGHSDVASMYPSLLINYQWGPRQLGKLFCDLFAGLKTERLEAKHTGQTLKNNFLKIVLNSPTGKMQQETSWMYDPFNVFKIRINGQLILLTMVDRLLELGCEIVQVNTDGVVYIAKKTSRDRIQEAIHDVEQLTRLEFETDEYEAFYQYAINDYFGVMKGYTETHNPKLIEKKGMFITETRLGKGLAPVIIPKAVINYFLTGESVSDYIHRCTDIKDFLMSQQVDKKFTVIHGERKIQRINRFYASTNGEYLFKRGQLGEESNMLTKSGVTILNTFDDRTIDEYKINYRYYISEANKIIADFVNQQLELFQ